MKKITAVILAFVLTMGLLCGCGSKVSAEDTVATLTPTASGDAITITYGEANFFSQYMQIYYDAMYSSFYGTGFWNISVDASGEATMADEMRSQFLDEVEQMVILNAHAADYNIALSEEDETKISEAAAQFMEDNDAKTLELLGATQEIVENYLRMLTVENRMQQAIYAEADVTIDEADALTRTFSYVTISKTATDASGNAIDYSDAAESLGEMMQEINGQDAEAFSTLATQQGYAASTYSYAANDVGMEAEVIEAADGLDENDITMIETDNAYYILHLDSAYDEAATEATREQLIADAQQAYFTEVYNNYLAGYEIEVNEDVLAQISFDAYYSIKAVEENSAAASGDAQ